MKIQATKLPNTLQNANCKPFVLHEKPLTPTPHPASKHVNTCIASEPRTGTDTSLDHSGTMIRHCSLLYTPQGTVRVQKLLHKRKEADPRSIKAPTAPTCEGLSVYSFLTSIPHYPVAQAASNFHKPQWRQIPIFSYCSSHGMAVPDKIHLWWAPCSSRSACRPQPPKRADEGCLAARIVRQAQGMQLVLPPPRKGHCIISHTPPSRPLRPSTAQVRKTTFTSRR